MMLSVVSPPATARLKPGVVDVERIVDPHAGLDRSAAVGAAQPPLPPMWLCVQIRPGMMILPVTSTFSAPAGICTASAGADGHDLSLFDHQHAVGDLVAFDGNDLRADERPRAILSGDTERRQSRARANQQERWNERCTHVAKSPGGKQPAPIPTKPPGHWPTRPARP